MADFAIERAHPCVARAEDLDLPPAQLPTTLLADTGWCAPDEGWRLPADLVPALDLRTHRAIGVRAQTLSGLATRVRYSTRLARGVVELLGAPPRVIEGGGLRPLRTRLFLGLVAGSVAAGAGVALRTTYLDQSEWFSIHGNGSTFAALSLLAGLAAASLVIACLRPNRARGARHWLPPAVVLLACVLGSSLAWFEARPSLLTATQAMAAGRFDRAQVELAGLEDLGIDPEGTAASRSSLEALRGAKADAQRTREVVEGDDFHEAAVALSGPWAEPGRLDRARAHFLLRSDAQTASAWAAKDGPELERTASLLGSLDPSKAARARDLAALLAAWDGALRSDFAHAAALLERTNSPALSEHRAHIHRALVDALAHAVGQGRDTGRDESLSLDDRAAALGQAIEDREQLDALDASPLDASPLDASPLSAPAVAGLEELRELLQAVDAQLERQRAKQRRQEAKRLERERRQRQRDAKLERRARERREAAAARQRRRSRPLRCRDGSDSPSCTCGGSHRGCCSRHGGVAGCG